MSAPRRRFLPLSLIPALLVACASTITEPLPGDASGQRQLDAGYALVRSLMNKEQQVDGILTIKSPSDETAKLLNDIAAAAEVASAQLSVWAEQSETLEMASAGLPKVEQSARNSIESATTSQLLLAGGERFEVAILVAQAKATQYAEHLFKTLAAADGDEGRSEWLSEQSEVFAELQSRVLKRLAVAQAGEE